MSCPPAVLVSTLVDAMQTTLHAAVAGVEPIVTGKPSPLLMEEICAEHGTQPSRMIMVGDRCARRAALAARMPAPLHGAVGHPSALLPHTPVARSRPPSHPLPSIDPAPSGTPAFRPRLDTDIAWGHATGMATLLVMTGCTTEPVLEAARAKPGFQLPDYVLRSFGDLLAVKAPLSVPA
jgi:phosphoglycolate phosphatase-like HAD superfamily hydrolase